MPPFDRLSRPCARVSFCVHALDETKDPTRERAARYRFRPQHAQKANLFLFVFCFFFLYLF